MYETGAPPAPPPLPDVHELVLPAAETDAPPPAARPARGYEATAVITGLGGPTPGTTTYRLRGVETSAGDGRAG